MSARKTAIVFTKQIVTLKLSHVFPSSTNSMWTNCVHKHAHNKNRITNPIEIGETDERNGATERFRSFQPRYKLRVYCTVKTQSIRLASAFAGTPLHRVRVSPSYCGILLYCHRHRHESHQQIYQSFGKTDFCASFHANCQNTLGGPVPRPSETYTCVYVQLMRPSELWTSYLRLIRFVRFLVIVARVTISL